MIPDRLVTDDFRSYGARARDLGRQARRERGKRKNNRAENSHQPRGDGSSRCSASRAQAQRKRFLSTHAAVYNTFNVERHPASAQTDRTLRFAAMKTWVEASAA